MFHGRAYLRKVWHSIVKAYCIRQNNIPWWNLSSAKIILQGEILLYQLVLYSVVKAYHQKECNPWWMFILSESIILHCIILSSLSIVLYGESCFIRKIIFHGKSLTSDTIVLHIESLFYQKVLYFMVKAYPHKNNALVLTRKLRRIQAFL